MKIYTDVYDDDDDVDWDSLCCDDCGRDGDDE